MDNIITLVLQLLFGSIIGAFILRYIVDKRCGFKPSFISVFETIIAYLVIYNLLGFIINHAIIGMSNSDSTNIYMTYIISSILCLVAGYYIISYLIVLFIKTPEGVKLEANKSRKVGLPIIYLQLAGNIFELLAIYGRSS